MTYAQAQLDITKEGLKHLISQMHKAEVKAYENEQGEKPKPIPKKIQKDIEKEEKKGQAKAKGTSPISQEMRAVVRGFFQKKGRKHEDKPVADLYIGRGRKRPDIVKPIKTKRRRKKA